MSPEFSPQRSDRVNTLILNANDLVGVLNDRRQAIVDLLENTTTVADQLTGVVHDNQAKLAPTLDKLNEVAALLEKNRDNIGKALPGLAKYELTQGETVASGYYYDAFVPNLSPAQFLQPFLDYAFGFRRGIDAGQPPDNAGPRAESPSRTTGYRSRRKLGRRLIAATGSSRPPPPSWWRCWWPGWRCSCAGRSSARRPSPRTSPAPPASTPATKCG